MITRQSVFDALFTLKNAGTDITEQLNIMKNNQGVPREIIEFLRNNSPQFQYYRYLQKHQRALMKNVLNYRNFDEIGKIKLCSSLITRAMIAIEYKDFDRSLMYEIDLEELSTALSKALNDQDYAKLDSALEHQYNNMKLFVKEENLSDDKS